MQHLGADKDSRERFSSTALEQISALFCVPQTLLGHCIIFYVLKRRCVSVSKPIFGKSKF